MTRTDESSLSRLASTLPAAPPPTIRKSTLSPSRLFDESNMFILLSASFVELCHCCQSRRFGQPFLVDAQPCGVHVQDPPLPVDLEVVVADVCAAGTKQ